MINKIPYDLICLSYSLGCLPLLFISSLPSEYNWYCWLILAILLCGIYFFYQVFKLLPIIFILLGFLWSTNYAKEYLIYVQQYIDETLVIRAKAISLNMSDNHEVAQKNVHFSITHINHQSVNSPLPIVLFWQSTTSPYAGQIWDMKIKTKVVHSYLNEGGFDSQRYAMANHLLLTGTVEQAKIVEEQIGLRQMAVNALLPYVNLFEYSDIMLALAFGDRSRLTPEHKKIMFETGIAHLMAISGMHILLVALMGNRLTRGLQFLLPNQMIKYWHPLLIGWVMALFYAWLTGLNVPALRAILALTLWSAFRYFNYYLTSWQLINRIIAILLIYDPLMILAESFWLSCYAVFCLIYIANWFPYHVVDNKWQYFRQLLRLQWSLTLLFLPLQLIIFNGISGVSLVANLLAIPLITIIIFPAILMLLVFSIIGNVYITVWFGFIADQTLYYLFAFLKPIATFWINVEQAYFLLSLSGWLMLIILRISFWRNYFISCLLILIILLTPLLKSNRVLWRVDMLDVGHGLAVVIRQNKSAILYDTGAKWQNSSAAERIIIPFLKWHGLKLEGTIISHEHNDHIGGLNVIQQHYPEAWLITSKKHLTNTYPCIAGKEMSWKNLKMTFLWPLKLHDQAFNAESCVVRITSNNFSLLLTGDLERQQEEQLVLKYRKLLFSTILQIPHHGSNTSSSFAFLSHVNPKLSIGSVSRYNPWKLPSNKALHRYEDLKLKFLLTSKTGQISLLFYQDNWLIQSYRNQIKPRWYHDWFGAFAK